jgi:hypothetical protein
LSAGSLFANGNGPVTPATIKGYVSFGSVPITLAFSPTSLVEEDFAHPSLYVNEGALSLAGNPFFVNVTTGQLGPGTYLIIQTDNEVIGSAGPVSVSPSLPSGEEASISVEGQNVYLIITPPASPPKIQTPIVSGNSLIFSWDPIPNPIQIETGFPGPWVPVGDPFIGNIFSAPVTGISQFFRLLVLPQ